MPTSKAKSLNQMIAESRTEENLTEADKIWRDAFCVQYIKDFQGKAALIRMGHLNPNTLAQKARRLLQEPYVANRIDELVRQLKPEDVVTRQEVMAAMWAEGKNPRNFDSTRVAALAHVAKMLGMYNKVEEESSAPIGVMFIPLVASEDWEVTARTAQELLKHNASTPPPCPPPIPVGGNN